MTRFPSISSLHTQESQQNLVVLDNLEDDVPGLLNTSLGADDLDGLALALRTRDLDLGAGLLPDPVDLGTAGANDVAVGTRVGQDEETDGVLLARLLESLVDLGTGGGDGFGRGADEDPGDLAILVGGVQGVRFEAVVVGVGGSVVSDQRHVSGRSAAVVCRRGLAGRRALAGVVDADLVVGAQTAEELAVVGDGVVVLERDLNGLALDLLGKLQDVSLGLLDIVRLAGHLDLRTSRASLALTRNVDGNAELLLKLATALTATADE